MINRRDTIRVLVVSSSEKSTDFFKGFFPQGFDFQTTTASTVGEAKRLSVYDTFDIAIINSPLRDESGIDYSIDLSSDSSTGVLLLTSSEYYEQISDEVSSYGVFTISKPTNRQVLAESVKLLIATNARLKKFEQKNARLTAKMEEIRIVNHAKWVLIENLSMSEEDAHKLIEKQAMDTRQSKKEVSERIIHTYRSN